MEKNRIIVTGLSLFKDTLQEQCIACDYDFEWVFTYPSTLLWADEIILSPSIMDVINKGYWPTGVDSAWALILRVFFDVAGEHGLLTVKNPKGILPEEFFVAATQQAEIDRNRMLSSFSEAVEKGDEKVPGELLIEGIHYCSPRIISLYTSLAIGRLWKCKLLLNSYSKNYLKYKLGLDMAFEQTSDIEMASFQQVFGEYIPELNIFPVECISQCKSCAHLEDCSSKQYKETEKLIREYIKYREYDEIIQMKEVFQEIATFSDGNVTPTEIAQEFKSKEMSLRKQIRGVFPKVKRWSSLITILSIPVIVFGVATANPVVAAAGAGIGGVSKIIDKYIDILSSKNRWVCFKQTHE